MVDLVGISHKNLCKKTENDKNQEVEKDLEG
jgi:hypothetical protein